MSSKASFIAIVLAASLPLPMQAHDVYSHLKDKAGASCCDDKDCRLAPYRFTTSGVEMFVDQRWISVPGEKIQYLEIPGDTGETGGGHWCGFADQPNRMDPEAMYLTRCAILPPRSASDDYMAGYDKSAAEESLRKAKAFLTWNVGDSR